jgi:hypothetical protein
MPIHNLSFIGCAIAGRLIERFEGEFSGCGCITAHSSLTPRAYRTEAKTLQSHYGVTVIVPLRILNNAVILSGAQRSRRILGCLS